MSVPEIVQSTLNGDEIAARVSLGGEDELFITSSSSLVYRSDGILSDESIEEYPHEADRLTLSEGRRKTKFTLEYSLEGTKEFTVPSDKTDAVLHPVLAGVLNGNGITDPGETVVKTYRFSELTLIITSDRLVKHIGGAVWDGDYEGYHFDDVTKLAFEDGSVATQIVLTVAGRPERIKAPNEEANDLRERLKRALFEYHGVTSLAEFNETVGVDEDGGDRDGGAVDFGDGVDPLDANPPEPDDRETVAATEAAADSDDSQSQSQPTDPLAAAGEPQQSQRTQQQSAQQSARATATQADTTTDDVETAFDGASDAPVDDEPVPESTRDDSGFAADAAAESASAASAATAENAENAADYDPAELAERIDSLEAAVEEQSELIERQQETIEQLIAELRQGR
ncbi:hypothetical protein HTZ84_05055 [Haloterrigena sp. SYSU A558-1]|uniref:DUF7115 domain-containing protein n=1 Tax=Haloterrigena gelatinilytica TaxID=2741724 RepID=A0A8J8GLW0_9EURY|nr:hypothetical protein [Haloterrigena gelatinilytica]NUB92423.1 hypothetical protein [Haloterrigena gelatinilytica]NUC71683.1 hypothetical protein [Haloterrigena gelatinilytica]